MREKKIERQCFGHIPHTIITMVRLYSGTENIKMLEHFLNFVEIYLLNWGEKKFAKE